MGEEVGMGARVGKREEGKGRGRWREERGREKTILPPFLSHFKPCIKTIYRSDYRVFI